MKEQGNLENLLRCSRPGRWTGTGSGQKSPPPGPFGKRFAGVTYGITIEEIEKNHGGMACLGPTNVVALDDFDDYIREMSERIQMEARS